MLYRFLADVVLVVHLGFVLLVVLGGLLVLRWRWVAWIHLPAAAWAAWIELAGGICPLTPLENSLRRRGGLEGYEGGFVERYLLGVIYPEGLTREVQIGLGVLVLAVNAGVYGYLLARSRRAPTAPPAKKRRKG